MDLDVDEMVVLGTFDDALGEGRGKHVGKDGEDIDVHRLLDVLILLLVDAILNLFQDLP